MSNCLKFQHVVPDEHLKEIGDITVSFAFLENELGCLVGILLGSENRLGIIVTAELSFKALLALVSSLYLECYGEDKNWTKCNELIQRAASIEEKRNLYTHSRWGVDEGTSSVVRIKTTAKRKNGLRVAMDGVSTNQLAELAMEIKVLIGDFMQFEILLARNKSKA